MALQVWLPLLGNINNQGLNGIEPTLMGTGITYVAGKIGNAAQFPNNCNSCIHMPGLNLQTGSFAAWIKIIGTGATSRQCIISEGRDSYNDGVEIYTNQAGTTLYFKAHNVILSTVITLNIWYHVCGTFGNGNIKLYLNGFQVASNTYTTDMTYEYSNNRLVLGKMSYAYTNTSSYFAYNGQLNDVRIYDHCLSTKEVKELSKGLVLHYKLDGRNETTTNLVTSITGGITSCYNGATNKYGFGENTDIYKVVDTSTGQDCLKIYMGTDNLDAYPYMYFPIQTAVGETKTLSFDYYPTIQNQIRFYNLSTTTDLTYVINGVQGTSTNTVTLPVNVNTWNHIELTTTNTGTASGGMGYMQIGTGKHTSSTSNYWLFANIQVEAKDHATSYIGVGGSRIYDIEFDCSGYGNNGIPTGDLTASSDTPKYNNSLTFPSGSNYIAAGRGGMVTDSITVNLWAKWTTWGNPVSCTEGGGWNFESSTGIRFAMYVASVGYKLAESGVTPDSLKGNWHMITGTFDKENVKVYIDGELKGTTATGSTNGIGYNSANGIFLGAEAAGNTTTPATTAFIGNLSDFRIYATALSAEDIAELYHTAASVDNHGNIYAGELKEV